MKVLCQHEPPDKQTPMKTELHCHIWDQYWYFGHALCHNWNLSMERLMIVLQIRQARTNVWNIRYLFLIYMSDRQNVFWQCDYKIHQLNSQLNQQIYRWHQILTVLFGEKQSNNYSKTHHNWQHSVNMLPVRLYSKLLFKKCNSNGNIPHAIICTK